MNNFWGRNGKVLEALEKADQISREVEAERKLRCHGRIYRPIVGVSLSNDHGKTWKLAALCDECKASVELPTRMQNKGPAGVRYCDWCGAINETGKPTS